AIVPPAPAEPRVVPAGSILVLQVDEAVTSKTAQQGDKFAITLAKPVTLDDEILVPAGTKGVGEVISAAHGGAFGKAGELVVAARYLQLDDQRIPLKAFKVGGSGSSGTDAALATAMLAGLPGIVFGATIKGGEMELPAGLVATAKLAADLPASPKAPAALPIPVAETASISN